MQPQKSFALLSSQIKLSLELTVDSKIAFHDSKLKWKIGTIANSNHDTHVPYTLHRNHKFPTKAEE